MSQHEKAIICFNKSIELKPDNFEIWYNQGIVFMKDAHLYEAIESFSKSIENYKDDLTYSKLIHKEDVFNNLGVCYYKIHNYEEAAKYFEKSIEEGDYEHIASDNLKKVLEVLCCMIIKISFYYLFCLNRYHLVIQ